MDLQSTTGLQRIADEISLNTTGSNGRQPAHHYQIIYRRYRSLSGYSQLNQRRLELAHLAFVIHSKAHELNAERKEIKPQLLRQLLLILRCKAKTIAVD